ncbi:MAG: tRNA pseudouridine(55) synthase TruB [Chloroflexi bacterium RBG_13_56_8]|nr:MAG: tRNA pseudouridine(55) synthase TruB [Chloroflexi bacterium RBG_13_56_8]
MNISGILNVDKPEGLTSHDVVDRIRRLSCQRRVGHAGTLDPMATGVLIVCLGVATRLAEYVADARKSYLATIRFGLLTDTWDAEGLVVAKRDLAGLLLSDIENALSSFRGCIEQVPPMYSALKSQGQPLYRLARQGITIERQPRMVEIYDATIVDWRPPDLVLRIECSKGTYVRSLAYDLGQAIGVGAHLCALTRLAVGRFRMEDAVGLETLWEGHSDGLWKRYLQPLHMAVSHLPSVVVGIDEAERILHGQTVDISLEGDGEICCAYGEGQRLLAILVREPASGLWRTRKVLANHP